MIMSLPLGPYTVFPQIGTCNADLIKACTGSKLLISTPCVSKLLQSLHQMAFVEVEVLKRRVGCNVLLSFYQKKNTHLPSLKLWSIAIGLQGGTVLHCVQRHIGALQKAPSPPLPPAYAVETVKRFFFKVDIGGKKLQVYHN